jgi:hypothetical protein
MKDFRRKDSSLPIKISIQIKIKEKKPTIEYYIDKGEKKDFEEIRDYLFNVKNYFISQLNIIYKEKLN